MKERFFSFLMGLRQQAWSQRKGILFWIVLSVILGGPSCPYGLFINVSGSLPHYVYLWKKGVPEEIHRGDYVVFKLPFKEAPLTKKVLGLPGDRVWYLNRTVLVNRSKVGVAKRTRSNGERLEIIKPQIIGSDSYYVSGSHERSFDSRYAQFGLIQKAMILGKAIPLC